MPCYFKSINPPIHLPSTAFLAQHTTPLSIAIGSGRGPTGRACCSSVPSRRSARSAHAPSLGSARRRRLPSDVSHLHARRFLRETVFIRVQFPPSFQIPGHVSVGARSGHLVHRLPRPPPPPPSSLAALRKLEGRRFPLQWYMMYTLSLYSY